MATSKNNRKRNFVRGKHGNLVQLMGQVRDEFLFGNSTKMKSIGGIIEQIADTDVPVLINGESGTGKDLIAYAIHAHSLRKNKLLVKLNCASLPGELLESELFGYEKGAFTGAYRNKPGKFEFANKGTMFLDEISEMPCSLQAKLLRVVQEGEFFRLGGKDEIKVDVRIVSATNHTLEEMQNVGKFREDLFHRLNVITIQIPPLRERKDEIFPLVNYFLKKYSGQYNRNVEDLTDKTFNSLLDYDWPGNVRELENIIKKIVVLGNEEAVVKEIINNKNTETKSVTGNHYDKNISLKDIGKKAALNAEKKAIESILQQTRWNRSKAAKILKVSYKTLLYKIKESGLDGRV